MDIESVRVLRGSVSTIRVRLNSMDQSISSDVVCWSFRELEWGVARLHDVAGEGVRGHADLATTELQYWIACYANRCFGGWRDMKM